MSVPFIAVAHARVTSPAARTLTLYNPDFSTAWAVDHGASSYSVDVDAAGNIYLGSDLHTASGYNVRSYSASGALRWSADTAYSSNNYTVLGIRHGGDGHVYTAQKATAFIGDTARTNIFKLTDSTGAEQWALAAAGHAYSVFANSDSRIRAATAYSLDVCQINSGGVRDWRVNVTNVAYGIARIDDEYFVVVGDTTSSKTVWKMRSVSNASPSVIWSVHHGATVRAVAVDAAGNVYIGGDRTSNLTTRKYSAAGALLWSADHGAQVNAIAVDTDGNVYTGGVVSGGYTCRKYSTTGTLLGSWNAGGTVNGLALLYPPDVVTEPPGIALGLATGVPVFTASASPPGIALGLSVVLPSFSAISVPPDPFLYPGAVLYRLYLSSPTGIVELPMSELQCRRRLGASTWVMVTVPVWTNEMEALVVACMGRDLWIEAGVRSETGETRGEFLRAILTDYAAQLEPQSGSATLTGRVQTPAYSRQTRALHGVAIQGASDGRRSARCAVDPLLRPNDTVVSDGEAWIAGSVTYQIGARGAWMDVLERDGDG